jgi:hypothetical protein
MAAIEALCSSAILVSSGRIEHKGTAQEIVSAYARSMAEIGHGRIDLVRHGGRSAGAETVMQNVTVFGDNDAPSVIRTDSLLSIRIEFKSRTPIRPCLGLTVKTDRGFKIFHVSDRFANQLAHAAPMRSGTVICEVPNLSLMPGRYVLDLWLEDFASQTSLDMIADAISFDVIEANVLGTGRLSPITEGPVFHRANWRLA